MQPGQASRPPLALRSLDRPQGCGLIAASLRLAALADCRRPRRLAGIRPVRSAAARLWKESDFFRKLS